jgi:hypothetical protein
MKKTLILTSAALFLVAGFVAAAQVAKQKAAPNTKVYIASPKNGETVSSPFTVQFGLKGMGIAPAGLNHPNTGHHHLLIDVEKVPDFNVPLPATDNIRHFGAGQTETELTLPPGKHTLQLVFADYLHIPHDSPVTSEKITIVVK